MHFAPRFALVMLSLLTAFSSQITFLESSLAAPVPALSPVQLSLPDLAPELGLEAPAKISLFSASSTVPRHSLSETLRRGLTSIRSESAESQETLRKQANWYVGIRRGGMSWLQKIQQVATCGKNPFCDLLKDIYSKSDGSTSTRQRSLGNHSYLSKKLVASWISDANLDRLAVVPHYDLRKALRESPSLSTFASIEKSITRISLPSTSCKTSNLGFVIGLRAEEFLPDENVRTKVLALYEKLSKCETGELGNFAHFRASLMQLWAGRCQGALPHLKYLIAHSEDGDYSSRALYWEAKCSKQAGDHVAAQFAQKKLATNHPMSLHALLSSESRSKLPEELAADTDIVYSSENNEKLNDRIRAVEALLQIQEKDLAKEALNKIEGELEKADPRLRLYIAVLYERMNSHNQNFRLLSAVFRDDANLISKPALELYYPRNIQSIGSYERNGVDGMLLLSLIRQESGFNARAKSSAGALGLMQLMPNTARRFDHSRRRERLFDPAINLKIGSRYFSDLMSRYNGDAVLALAAYNAGEKRIDQWVLRYPVKDRALFLDLIPFKETRKYVASIARNYFWYVALYPDNRIDPTNITDKNRGSRRSMEQVFRLAGT